MERMARSKAPEVKDCAQGVLNGCDTGAWRQLKGLCKRLLAAHLYGTYVPG